MRARARWFCADARTIYFPSQRIHFCAGHTCIDARRFRGLAWTNRFRSQRISFRAWRARIGAWPFITHALTTKIRAQTSVARSQPSDFRAWPPGIRTHSALFCAQPRHFHAPSRVRRAQSGQLTSSGMIPLPRTRRMAKRETAHPDEDDRQGNQRTGGHRDRSKQRIHPASEAKANRDHRHLRRPPRGIRRCNCLLPPPVQVTFISASR